MPTQCPRTCTQLPGAWDARRRSSRARLWGTPNLRTRTCSTVVVAPGATWATCATKRAMRSGSSTSSTTTGTWGDRAAAAEPAGARTPACARHTVAPAMSWLRARSTSSRARSSRCSLRWIWSLVAVCSCANVYPHSSPASLSALGDGHNEAAPPAAPPWSWGWAAPEDHRRSLPAHRGPIAYEEAKTLAMSPMRPVPPTWRAGPEATWRACPRRSRSQPPS